MIIDYAIPQINSKLTMKGAGDGGVGIFIYPYMTASVVKNKLSVDVSTNDKFEPLMQIM